MTLQELSNLERFVKRNGNKNADPEPPAAEQLLKEEAYLKSRLAFVQQAWARVGTGAGAGTGRGTGTGTGTGFWVPRARVDLWWRDVGWMGKANRRLRVRGVCHHSRPTPWQELRRAHALGSAGAPSGSAEPKSPLRSRAAVLETTTKTLEETVLDSALAI